MLLKEHERYLGSLRSLRSSVKLFAKQVPLVEVRQIAEPPPYQAISDVLRREIHDGVLAPGAPFPTLAELRDRFDISSGTAGRAVDQLAREGLVASTPGTRTTVRRRPVPTDLMRTKRHPAGTGSPWRAQLEALGRTGAWEAHSTPGTARADVAARLGIDPDARVMCTRYLYTDGGRPAFLATSWEPWDLTSSTQVLLPEAGPYAGAGVVDRMTAIGHPPTHATEKPRVGELTAADGRRLGLNAGIPVLEIERTYYEADRPLETATLVLPPEYTAVYVIQLG
jgi:GntR family transcriptional regulator